MTTLLPAKMSLLKKAGTLLKRLGSGILWVGGKWLYFVFVYPISPVFHAGKYLKLLGIAAVDVVDKISQMWRQIGFGKNKSNSEPERDFEWCLKSWHVTENTIADRIQLWKSEIVAYVFLGVIITWAALQWQTFWPWLDFAIVVPVMCVFITNRAWQIACLGQRKYIHFNKRRT
jgi:hypothetical protein